MLNELVDAGFEREVDLVLRRQLLQSSLFLGDQCLEPVLKTLWEGRVMSLANVAEEM